ncbi:aspartate 1-decarboxylase [Clostridiaceae bacterium M8S5]|nr:aspartate 1-decarboxylase [Clostridiaceae bacterium M8S5]
MLIEMMTGKLHKARVTDANLNYEGSITIDEELIEAASMVTGQKVQIVNNNNGARFETYIIKGERGSGIICLNGAAARLAQKDDIIIIIAYGLVDKEEVKNIKAKSILLDKYNKIIKEL